ncbi:MAG TPA: ACT domain-containing protein [Anaeromyxobacteraceae bacterium]|nr:ACT domain-containing protein [Anaeromyxobacteraceae bacterium]
MPRATELKIRVDDRPGILGEIATALGAKKVNLRAVNAWVEGSQGILRLVVDKPAAAKKALAAKGYSAEERDVLELTLADKPGELGRVAQKLGEAGINIQYVFVGSAAARKVSVFMGVPDVKAAMAAAR